MGEKGEPVTFAVFAKSNEYPTPIRISGYSGTMEEIRGQVLARARKEGFRGDFVERMADLGWWLEPLMTVAQHDRIVAGLEARMAEARDLLIDSRSLLRYLGQDMGTVGHRDKPTLRNRIDAFLAQTADGV